MANFMVSLKIFYNKYISRKDKYNEKDVLKK